MSTMAGGDRLSRLNDDVLRRVLYFVPAKEGALTTALSRRWRLLWPSSGAINLVARIREKDEGRYGYVDWEKQRALFYARRDAFVSGAHAALDAFAEADDRVPVTKLTFRVEAPGHRDNTIRDFLQRDADWREHNVIGGVLSHPAALGVEELQIAAVDSRDGEPMYFETSKYEAISNIYGLGIYPLGLGCLPSETLRVLELTNCSEITPASPPTSFPRLVALRLRHCNMPLKGLQRIIDVAPLLGSIHLEAVLLEDDRRYNQPSYQDDIPPSPEQGALLRSLRCPSATTLVIDKCSMKEDGTIEIYAPMLRRFEYTGVLRHISLSPPPPELARADMNLIDYGCKRDRDPDAGRRSFWGFVHGFSHAKQVKLRVRHLEDIAVTSEASQVKLLPMLLHLERLELQGVYTPTGRVAATAISNLLHCCPALRDLRINLRTAHEDTNKKLSYGLEYLERKYRSDFQESIQRFKRRRSQPTQVARDDDDEHDDGNYFDEVSDLHGLSGQSFKCLRSCLRPVRLQFLRQRTDCFGIKLIKFFAEHAKVMEEMCIDAGNQRISEHINPKVRKWIANKSKRRRIKSTSEPPKFEVLSLKRSNWKIG
ncbi:unnamed protein product [Alopecurus aequalis]